jgi:hypothetical protein
MQITPTSPISPTTRVAPDHREPNSNSAQEAASQRALAQVIRQESGRTLVKTLPGGQTLELQTSEQLRNGQLVVLEQKPGQLTLSTQPKTVADQILRHLLPHSGQLKPALLTVLKTALSQLTALSAQTALSGQTALSAQTALSGQTALGAQTALSGQTALGAQIAVNREIATGLGQQAGTINLMTPANGITEGLLQVLNQARVTAGQSDSAGNAAGQSAVTSSLESQLLPLFKAALSSSGQTASSVSESASQSTNLIQQLGQLFTANPKHPINQPLANLLGDLPSTQALTDPAQIASMFQSQATIGSLIKLMLPLLKSVLLTPPTNGQEQERRMELLPKLSQLIARVLLSAVRSPGNGLEAEVGRGEWLTRHDNSLDSLQIELGVVRQRSSDENQEQDQQQDQKPQVRRWTVRLSFDFEELGLITAFIILVDNRALEMNFWAEREATRHKIEYYQQQFRQKLNDVLTSHGIERLTIDVHEGDPPPAKPQVTTQLVDEVA